MKNGGSIRDLRPRRCMFWWQHCPLTHHVINTWVWERFWVLDQFCSACFIYGGTSGSILLLEVAWGVMPDLSSPLCGMCFGVPPPPHPTPPPLPFLVRNELLQHACILLKKIYPHVRNERPTCCEEYIYIILKGNHTCESKWHSCTSAAALLKYGGVGAIHNYLGGRMWAQNSRSGARTNIKVSLEWQGLGMCMWQDQRSFLVTGCLSASHVHFKLDIHQRTLKLKALEIFATTKDASENHFWSTSLWVIWYRWCRSDHNSRLRSQEHPDTAVN